MAGKTQVKNQEYIEAYNAYLADHNLVQARATFVDVGGLDYPIDVDMFYNYLVDQVAMQIITDVRFNDPLGDLYKGTIPEGRIIQDISPISGYDFEEYDVQDFEDDVTNPYKKKKDKLSVYYMTTEAYKKVKTTYSRKQVLSAFQTAYGIDALVNALVTLLYTKKNAWRYNAKKQAIASPNFVTRKVVTSYEDFTLKVKDLIDELQYSYNSSWKYNRAVIPKPVSFNDIVIIMKAKYKNRIDVEYLAGLYNVSFAELKGKIKYIDEFPGMPQRVAVICDVRGLYFYQVLNMDTDLFNPADITTNRWVHFWEMIESCPNYNAIAFDEVAENQVENQLHAGLVQFTITDSTPDIKYIIGQENAGEFTGTIDEFNAALPTLSSPTELPSGRAPYMLIVQPPERSRDEGWKYSINNGELQDVVIDAEGQVYNMQIPIPDTTADGLTTLKVYPPQSEISQGGANEVYTYVVRLVKVFEGSAS